jgi:hypothetical protein
MGSVDPRLSESTAHLSRLVTAHSELSDKIRSELVSLIKCLRGACTAATEYQQQERKNLKEILTGFKMNTSAPFIYFTDRGWANLTVPELVSIAELFANEAGIPIDRESKRRKEVLFKWFSDNWDQCEPVANDLVLEWARDQNEQGQE